MAKAECETRNEMSPGNPRERPVPAVRMSLQRVTTPRFNRPFAHRCLVRVSRSTQTDMSVEKMNWIDGDNWRAIARLRSGAGREQRGRSRSKKNSSPHLYRCPACQKPRQRAISGAAGPPAKRTYARHEITHSVHKSAGRSRSTARGGAAKRGGSAKGKRGKRALTRGRTTRSRRPRSAKRGSRRPSARRSTSTRTRSRRPTRGGKASKKTSRKVSRKVSRRPSTAKKSSRKRGKSYY